MIPVTSSQGHGTIVLAEQDLAGLDHVTAISSIAGFGDDGTVIPNRCARMDRVPAKSSHLADEITRDPGMGWPGVE